MSMDVELLLAAVGIGGTAVGAVAGYFAKRRDASARERIATTIKDEKLGLAEATARATTEDKLWERLSKVEEETERCHREREEDRQRYAEQREADRAACDERVRSVETDLRKVAARLLEARKSMAHPPPPDFADDDTGLHELEDIANGRSTPPPPLTDDDARAT